MTGHMKVALFTDADVFAGTERHMLDLGVGLRDLGVGVTMSCPVPSPLAQRAAAAGLGVVAIPKRGRLDWRAVRTVRRLVRDGRVDVVHAHNGRTALLAALAVRLAGRGRCVATQHFLTPCYVTRRGLKAWLSTRVHRWVDRRTHHLIAISDATCQGSLTRGEADAGGITVVPNGIRDPEAASLASTAEVRRSLGIKADVPLVVCVARLEREKDVGSLVSAMALVKASVPTARCVVAGGGSQEDALRARVRREGLEDTVELLGFRDDAMAVIAASDVFVLPSLAEPFGLVLLEAMALGKPVVSTAVGGPLEIVVEGETGHLVAAGSPPELANVLIKLLNDSTARERMGSAGRRRFVERFTAGRMARDVLAVYRRTLGLDGPGTMDAEPRIDEVGIHVTAKDHAEIGSVPVTIAEPTVAN